MILMAEPTRRSKKQQPLQSFNFPEGSVAEGDLKFKPKETAEERKHRHRTDNRTFWVKEAPAYLVAIFTLLATAIYCFWGSWSEIGVGILGGLGNSASKSLQSRASHDQRAARKRWLR
jgi:hypothetical protein